MYKGTIHQKQVEIELIIILMSKPLNIINVSMVIFSRTAIIINLEQKKIIIYK